MTKKKYIYKIFDNSSTLWDVAEWDTDFWNSMNAYVNNWAFTWGNDEVLNEPTFRTTLGSGSSELIVKLARKFNDFGENDDVKLGNTVQLWCYDRDNPNGILVYTGKITAYTPVLNMTEEYVNITVLGLAYELEDYILRDSSGNTTLAYNSKDPGAILRDVMDKYIDDGGSISYTTSSIELTGTTVSYTFSLNTLKECVDKINELAPDGWFVYVDETGQMQFHNTSTTHNIAVGREIIGMETSKTIEKIVNRVYGVGGVPEADIQLYKVYSRQNSIDTYGLKAEKLVDGRVTLSSTLDLLAERELARYEMPITKSLITLIDNNGSTDRGVDIESINVGDFIKINNLKFGSIEITRWDQSTWDIDVWDQPIELSLADSLQIVSLTYYPDKIILEVADRLPEVTKRVEDLQRNLEQEQTKDIPISPI